MDAKTYYDQVTASATVVSPSFSTVSKNELLLAFVAADYRSGSNTTVTNVTGSGLSWTLVKRTNTQAGTAEIWRAFATSPLSRVNVTATLSQSVTSSIAVMTFTGADTSGTNGSGAIGATGTGNSGSGAPTASLTTTRSGSWVIGVGVDFDAALNRTVGANQTIVHQDLQSSPSGIDTFWVQMQSAPTPLSGTTVTINDTAPTQDRYDLSICEVLPTPTPTPKPTPTPTASRPAALAMDAKTYYDQVTASATVVSPSFSTVSKNELLLAFVAADYRSGSNTTVTNVTGSGLSWTLVKRTNTQAGTAEIWRAFATSPLSRVNVTATLSQSVTSSIAVMTFTGADTSGTNGSGAIGATGTGNSGSGAPTASLTTTRSGSWVIGVGVDFDAALNRTVGANQTIVHQDLQSSPSGIDTFWVQMQSAPTPLSGTTVTINDTAPTQDRYDFSICEVLPTPAASQPAGLAMDAKTYYDQVTASATIVSPSFSQQPTQTGIAADK
jgi:hypothetical protein